jgi:hypothetical protein
MRESRSYVLSLGPLCRNQTLCVGPRNSMRESRSYSMCKILCQLCESLGPMG